MNRKIKLFLMFGPFVLFFAVFAVLVTDARHPAITKDECIISGTGNEAQKYKRTSQELYHQSDNINNDVSLRCEKMGNLFLNDTQIFITPVETGQGAWVSLKEYRYLPKRWMVSVYTGKED